MDLFFLAAASAEVELPVPGRAEVEIAGHMSYKRMVNR